MTGSLETTRVTIGLDDGGECTGTRNQECTEGQRKATEGRVSSASAENTDRTTCQTEQSTDSTAIDSGAVLLVSDVQLPGSCKTGAKTYL